MIDDIKGAKKKLRKDILAIRNNIDTELISDYSYAIINQIKALPVYLNAKDVCIYMPIRNEVNLTYMIDDMRDSGKCVWLPKVIDDNMDFYLYDVKTSLVEGAFHILEPDSDVTVDADDNTLIIMPGAVFTTNHDRIGYGGGYYDRYLSIHPTCHKIAVCYDFQVVDNIPCEEHDIKPELIVTEKRYF